MTAADFTSRVLPLRDKCYRFAVSMLRNGPESEDVAQDVLLKLWDRRERLGAIDNLEAFAIRATRNAALDRMRHSAWRTRDTDELYGMTSAEVAPDRRVEEAEAVSAVFATMAHLPEVQRAILHLREVEQQSYDEIAATLEISAAKVKVYLHRARKRVRELIDPAHAPSPSAEAAFAKTKTRDSQTPYGAPQSQPR